MPTDDLRDDLAPRPHDITTFTYDCEGEKPTVTYAGTAEPVAMCDHDYDERLFRVTDADGTTAEFHDRAVQFLVVEPDPETGELELVMSRGRP
jgi:hypothetical protein